MKEHPIECVGILMDGNRRWARKRNLSTQDGHIAGFERMQECLRWIRQAEIPHVVVYAFSTENWNRSQEEVGYLMSMFRSMLKQQLKKMPEEHIRVRIVGDRSRFDKDIQELMDEVEKETAGEYKLTLHLLLSYGGRAEIVSATNKLLAEEISHVTEESFATYLWSYPMPDPDLIIRTGGDKRLSNFAPWQSVYSELFFTDTLWPDFSKEELQTIFNEFSKRERRHGK